MALFEVKNVSIKGISSVVPKHKVHNGELDFFSKSEAEAFINTTGIEERRIATEKISVSDLSISTAERLISSLNWDKAEIQFLVLVTQTPDYIIPGTSMYIQNHLGLPESCMCFDINQGCAGYVYGLSVLGNLVSNAPGSKGLLIVSDTITKTIRPGDRGVEPVFSDAGSCTALEYDNRSSSAMKFNLQSDGSGYEKIIYRNSGFKNPGEVEACFLDMNGQDIFTFGLSKVAPNVKELIESYNINLSELNGFVMHQANKLLNETIRKQVGVESSITPYSLKEYGNTSCASIPVTICTAYGNGQSQSLNLLLSGFGVGLSWGSAYIKISNGYILEVNELG